MTANALNLPDGRSGESVFGVPQARRRDEALRLALKMSDGNLINGRLVPEASGERLMAVNPALGESIGSFADSSAVTVGHAVDAANAAFSGWANTSPLERGRLLLESANELERAAESIASLISLETGRPYRTESLPEVRNAVRIFRYFAGVAFETKGDAMLYGPSVLAFTLREPLGVVAGILPWNVPAMLLCLKAAPALAAGNTIVLKPAEEAALSTTLVAVCIASALPAGVINVVNGTGEGAGVALVNHPDVVKVTFTGSVETGRTIAERCASKLIPVTLELGGKSPMIVFPDVDIDRAAAHAVIGMRYSRQGQSCTSTTRLLVHSSIRERFISALLERVRALKIGDPLEDDTDIGTLVSPAQADRVRRYLDHAKAQGFPVLELNSLPSGSMLRTDSFVAASLILDPPMRDRVVQEEIFGPVATLHSWEAFHDVAALANGTPFGLSASILTDNLGDALTLARLLEAGFIQVNSGMVIQPGLSFGGYRSSGVGRESSLDSMLEAFTQVKTVIIDHSRGV